MSYSPPTHFNLATYLLDQRVVEGRGDRIAIRHDLHTLTYRDVVALSARCAHILAAADVRPEERVIIALPDGPLFVGALFGVIRRGAVVVMVNPDLPAETLRYFCQYTRATAAFIHTDNRTAWDAALVDLPRPPRLLVAYEPVFRAQLAAADTSFLDLQGTKSFPDGVA